MGKHVRIYRGVQLKSELYCNGTHPLQHNRPTTCDITQQYSYDTFVSLVFHSHMERLGTHLKHVTLSFIFFIKTP
jgi:hypothetical protein